MLKRYGVVGIAFNRRKVTILSAISVMATMILLIMITHTYICNSIIKGHCTWWWCTKCTTSWSSLWWTYYIQWWCTRAWLSTSSRNSTTTNISSNSRVPVCNTCKWITIKGSTSFVFGYNNDNGDNVGCKIEVSILSSLKIITIIIMIIVWYRS